jgi:NADH-quinone oxidoreductase subunit L
MVTAGVYLIARTHVLFALAPTVQSLVAVIGAATLLISGFSALAQKDIKRVLAYSTISQIGYMFLALGVGAWTAAMFHFMTHAFFKALLFLGAGVVINALHHEHDMFRMGGLRKELPVAFWTFLIGAASLSSLPLVTAGFFSKDLILWHAWASPMGGTGLWLVGLAGALITSLYTFRMVFLTFFGDQKTKVSQKPGKRMMVPLVILALLSVVGGYVEVPHTRGDVRLFSDFMSSALPETLNTAGLGAELTSQVIASLVSLTGIYLAFLLFLRYREQADRIVFGRTSESIRKFWLAGWDFDALYDRLFVRPFIRIAEINKSDFIDAGYTGIANVNRALHSVLSSTQTGSIRWYALGIAAGAVVFLLIIVILQ